MATRTPIQIINGRPSVDGDGVKIQRILGMHRHDLDPFLMLDEIRSIDSADYVGGFPPHPHRGIETFTYMLTGGFIHEDHLGHRAELRDGGVQWMSTGRGIIHSELPLIKDGLLHGFQLWINLPAIQKMKAPEYAQTTQAQLPVHHFDNGATAHILGGQWQFGEKVVTSPLNKLAANARVLDLCLPAHSEVTLSVPTYDAVLAYVFEGSLNFAQPINTKQLVRFSDGDEVHLIAGDTKTRLLLLAGTPLNEPIVQHGPFVMNTEDEIKQAINDYQTGKLT